MKKLKLLLAFCALLLGWSNASAQGWTASTPANGEFYLYNVGAQKFLCSGNDWGSHASVTGGGIPVTLAGSENTYTISTNSIYQGKFLDGEWMDGGSYEWTFEEVSDNVYKLKGGDKVLYWNGGTSTKLTLGDDPGTNASQWMLVTDANRRLYLSNATESNPMDATFLIKNAYFAKGNGSYLTFNKQGYNNNPMSSSTSWKGTGYQNFWGTDGGNENACYCIEQYNNTFDNYQELTVPNGKYVLKAKGFYRGNVVPVIYANNVTCDLKPKGDEVTNLATAAAAFRDGNYLLDGVSVIVTDGSLRVGVKSDVKVDWCAYDDFTLTYYGEDLSIYVDNYNSSLTNAKAIDQDKPMTGSVKTALQDAIATYETGVSTTDKDALITASNALSTATTNANASIAAYAKAKEYLDEAATILAGTNVYTTAAYTAYYTEPKAKYDARTLTNDEANALEKTSTGWHSVNTIDDILLSTWTIGGEQCSDYNKSLYINTWSVEGNTDGSEFLAPFFEYWVGDTQTLGANNLVSTVTGLKANTTYSFTIRARVRQTNNATKIANGITMKVGEGEAVDISSGAQFGAGQFYIGNFSAVGQTDADGKLVTTITVAENSNISWLSFYNAKYTEGEDLSAYIADYEFAKTTATNNNNNAAYAAVTGKEKADLTNALTTYATVDETSKSALIAAKEALETASNTFVAAAPAYIAFAELNKTVAAKLSVSLPTITSETVAADLDNEAYIVAEYTAAKTYTKDYTEKLGAWTNAPGTNKGESWNGDANDTYYDLYNAAARAMTQTVTLPAGDYALIAKGRASVNGRLTVTVDGQTVTFPHKSSSGRGIATNGDATFDSKAAYANSNNGRGWEYRVMTFTSDGVAATTLTFDWTTASNNWCGLDDIELLCNPAALDYSALQTAYDAVELPTLGFADGEYAPYVNAANLQNIATAKDYLDNETASSQAAIDDLKTALTSMTWTANVGEVNAFYKGDFNGYAEDTSTPLDYTPNGWTATANFRVMIKNVEDYPGLADASAGTAAMSWSGGITYGEQTGYEMPLAAHTIYELTFKAAGWNKETRGDITVNVKNGSAGMVAKNLGKASKDISEGMSEFSVLFVTGETGNYVFSVSSANNMVLTDFRLVKAASQVLEFADNSAVPTYAPGTYPSVKITRTLTAGKWATAVYPFAVSGVDNIAVLNSYNSTTGELGFTSAAASTANVPFFMMSNTDKSEITLNNVAVAAASAENATADEASLIGAYTTTDIDNTAKNYVLSDNKIFSVGEAGATINPYRAYIQLTEGGLARALRFVVDGQITGVDNVAAEAAAEVKDGKYIENGKVVIVKNGKKFNANGQQVK